MQRHVQDLGLLGNGNGSCQIVARDHPHVDACRVATLDGRAHLGPQGVLDAHDRDQGEVRLATECRSAIAVPHHLVELVAGDLVHVLVSQANRAHCAVGKGLNDLAREPRLLLGLDRNLLQLAIHERFHHTPEDDLACTLSVDAVAAAWLRHCPRHHLARGGEGAGPAVHPRFGRSARSAPANRIVVHTELIRKLEQGTLRRIPLEDGLVAASGDAEA
mmetsp:Transcript_49772/g.133240  ORF Transcript_49772/g.133240 Transcript_49772/m.133240 type:complete len:218 (-) Transcript_49772:845-1498(-)